MFKRSRIAMLVAGALFAAQAGADMGQSDAIWSDRFPPPEQLTVFNPDGSAYSIVPIEMNVVVFDPSLLIAANEPLPERLTVFEPNGLIYSYEFTPVEPVAMLEPIDIVVVYDDVSIEPVALSDDDANAEPAYVAHFVSPPSYTGILETTIS